MALRRRRLRAAVFPPGGSQVAVAAAGALAVLAVGAVAVGTGAVLPAGRVFGLVFVGLLGGLATLAVARSRGPGGSGGTEAKAAVAALAVADVSPASPRPRTTWPSTLPTRRNARSPWWRASRR